ncbi:MAG: hypothetical protein PVF19_07285, partial [Gemmatimonadota bacterium]
SEVHKLLTTERILGLDLLRGRKEPVGPEKRPAGRTVDHEGATPEERPPTAPTEDSDSTETSVPAAVAALPHPSDVEEERDGDRSEGPEGSDTEGLPLFSGDDPSEGGGRGGRGS